MESRCVAFGSGFFHSAGGVASACLRGYFRPRLLLQMPAVPIGSSGGSHLPFWFMSTLDNAEGCQGLGRGLGRVWAASHFCCALKLASQLAGPLSPGDPQVCSACTVLGIEHWGESEWA